MERIRTGTGLDKGRKTAGVASELLDELRYRRVQHVTQGKGWRSGDRRFVRFPNNVEDHFAICGVNVVPVLMPTALAEIDLDVARDGRLVIELDDCLSKIGSGFTIPNAGMKNRDGSAVECSQHVPSETLFEPDALDDTFIWWHCVDTLLVNRTRLGAV